MSIYEHQIKRMKYKKNTILFFVGGIALLSMFFIGPNFSGTTSYQTASIEQSTSQFQEKNQMNIVEYTVKPGDTFATVMDSFEVPYEDTKSVLDISKDVYDFTRIKAGQFLKLVFVKNAFAAVEYAVNDEKVIIVEKQEDDFEVREESIQYNIEQAIAKATITTSLFVDASAAGIEDKTILELAEIFGWDIDFATDIREGDAFKIVYEKRSKNGEPANPGKILAARFENQGEVYQAYYYQTTDGKEDYYDTRGESLSRQFLKSPINFGYVSSGFSYSRVNPVTKQVTPHRAIDYAAPKGTPVVAIAEGEITLAGTKGGLGITIEVEHGQYKSQYAHLSKIKPDVKRGTTVYQGDVIGYVGSTGISTGPHLQYAFFKDGTPINPLTAKLPPGKPLDEAEQSRFVDATRGLRQQINK